MMFFVDLANPANSLHRMLVTDMTAQCITGIRRLYNDPSLIDDLNGALDKAFLCRFGVNDKVLGHETGVIAP